MNSASGAAVVVGADGSEPSLRAVRLAAREAALRQRPLRVVHGFIWPLLRVPLGPAAGSPPGSGLRQQAERVVAEAVAEAEAHAPGTRITGEIIDGAPAAVLLGESPTAALIVLGNRGLGGFATLVVGSVALQVATYADCPVLVARGATRDHGPVVVGVDDSGQHPAAVEFAADAAAARGAPLRAVHAHSGAPGGEQVLADALAGLAARRPELPVERVLARDRAARALTEASRDARLLVVGGRGRGTLAGLFLGSISQSVLHYADCPVAVVRTPG
ncbi:universal stress protein [Micromonospora okii]|uniref:universal stress protein n=1 Tax=Micromonospora okii TaxID=1182970 RepID=UPI001E554B87|nr:universal stress protein [Micromonospora okii]